MSYPNHPSADGTTSKEELERWSNHENDSIRWNVAKNPNTPKHVLIRMTKEEADIGIWTALIINPSSSNEVIYSFLNSFVLIGNQAHDAIFKFIAYNKNNILNEENANLMYDLGCRSMYLMSKVDLYRLKEWVQIDKSNRQSYFNELIIQKQQELVKLWL